jgi:hypothetical protein
MSDWDNHKKPTREQRLLWESRRDPDRAHRALPKAPPEILDILLGIENEIAPVERNINDYGRALAEESASGGECEAAHR